MSKHLIQVYNYTNILFIQITTIVASRWFILQGKDPIITQRRGQNRSTICQTQAHRNDKICCNKDKRKTEVWYRGRNQRKWKRRGNDTNQSVGTWKQVRDTGDSCHQRRTSKEARRTLKHWTSPGNEPKLHLNSYQDTYGDRREKDMLRNSNKNLYYDFYFILFWIESKNLRNPSKQNHKGVWSHPFILEDKKDAMCPQAVKHTRLDFWDQQQDWSGSPVTFILYPLCTSQALHYEHLLNMSLVPFLLPKQPLTQSHLLL